MNSDSPDTDAFESIDADPDAVLAAFDVDSPTTLLEGCADAEHATVDNIDLAAVTELFDESTTTETRVQSNAVDDDLVAASTPEFEFVGESEMVTRSAGDHADSTAPDCSDSAVTAGHQSANTSALVGPAPTPTRIDDAAFSTDPNDSE